MQKENNYEIILKIFNNMLNDKNINLKEFKKYIETDYRNLFKTMNLDEIFSNNRRKEASVNDVKLEIKNLLKEGMNINSLSVAELSKTTGVCVAVIYDLMNNKALPKYETLVKLLKGINCKISCFTVNGDVIISFSPHCFNYKDEQQINSQINTIETLLLKEGLTKESIKEILSFINFKKMIQKK